MKTFSRSIALAVFGSAFCLSPLAWGVDQQHEVPLNYNLNAQYNGIGDVGFQSISDRALISDGSLVPSSPSPVVSNHGIEDFTSSSILSYHVVTTPGTLDTVALTPRAGLPASGNFTSNLTTLKNGIRLDTGSRIGVLYNYTNGGGTFDITLGFADGTSVTTTLAGPDWYGVNPVPAAGPGVASQMLVGQPAGIGYGDGTFDGTGGVDNPVFDHPLNVVEGVLSQPSLLTLGTPFDINGKILTSVGFGNKVSGDNTAAVGIYAIDVTGTQLVPEPASLGLLGLCAAGLLRRRRGM